MSPTGADAMLRASAAETRSLLLQEEDSGHDGLDKPPTPPLFSVSRWRAHLQQFFRSPSCLPYSLLVLAIVLVVVLAVLLGVLLYRDVFHDYVFLTSDDFPVDWQCPPPLPASPFPSSRVLILSADDRPLPAVSSLPADVSDWPYYLLTDYVNSRYAAQHGYHYQRHSEAMASRRASSWGKLWHLLHSVDWAAYDYVLAVDSDAWFTRMHVGLHDMLHCFAPDALPSPSDTATASSSSSSSSTSSSSLSWSSTAPLLIFGHDWADNAAHANDLNAGVFIMRTTPAARALAEQWWQVADLPGRTHLQSEWPFEQGVLNEVFMLNATIAPHIRRLPRNIIYGHAAAYISHVTSFWPGQAGWKGRRGRLIMNDIVRADIEQHVKQS